VKPSNPKGAEDVIPIKITRFELACRSVATVRYAGSTPCPETALSKVQAVSDVPANTIKRSPLQKLSAYAPLKHKIFKQSSDVIVGESRANGGSHSKAAPEPAGHVIFPSSFPNPEFPGASHAGFSRIKTKHDFSK
jgi:hypothetical protein